MKYTLNEIRDKLSEKGLKVTPQRLAILEAIYTLDNHPTAETIIESVRKKNPNIASGTVYKVLDTFIENELVRKVNTDRDIMRYDGVMHRHHHLYCTECDLIQDYADEKLDKILKDYFKERKIEGFHIEDFVLQIKGTFDKC